MGSEMCIRDSTATGIRIAVREEKARYPLTIDPAIQSAYLKASNTGGGDRFGRAIAISGDTVVVGAPGENSNATGVNGDQTNNSLPTAGSVYVFVRNGGTWSQQAYLKASNTDSGDHFGSQIAISGDTLVIAATGESSCATGVNGNQSDNSCQGSGAVYVFTRAGGAWSQQAYLKASNTDPGDFFGGSVAVSGDTIVVGAGTEDSTATGVQGNQADNGAQNSGAAYVFVRNGTTWTQQAYLKASNTDADDRLGAVSISGDTVVLGAAFEDSSATGVNGDQTDNSASSSGAAYVFVRSGNIWTQQAYLKASNADPGDIFGAAVCVSEDTIVVGATAEMSAATGINGDQTNNSASNSGAAYVFVRSGNIWTQQAYLKASNAEELDMFGARVEISRDTVVIGAQFESSASTGVNGDQVSNGQLFSGAAYVFARQGSHWVQQAYLKASNTDTEDLFGRSVAVSETTVVVGADAEDSPGVGVDSNNQGNGLPQSGAAYFFDLLDFSFPVGTAMCAPINSNSTGQNGQLTADGSPIATDNSLTFLAADLPLNQAGFLINSRSNIGNPTLISDGLVCHGPDFGRHNMAVGNSGSSGTIATTVDLTALPRPGAPEPALAGQTWYFQFWYRDGPGVSNLTNSIQIEFQ